MHASYIDPRPGARKRPPHPAPGRAAFDLPPGRIWLDTAHQGPLPRAAAAALAPALRWKADPSHLTGDAFFETPERARAAVARLLAVPPDEVILGNGASHGLDLLARGLGLGPGDEILLVRDDFPATVTPWLPLRERGVRVRFLPRREGLDAEAVAAALRPGTRLFCTTWVDSFSGHVLDPAAVGAVCRDRRVLFVLNGTQGVGALPLSPAGLPVDALACAGYKWLCGPYGTGFCWVRPDLLDRLETGTRYWLPAAREGGLEELAGLVDGDPPRGARAHDAFCTASFFNVMPWTAALGYLVGLGPARIRAHDRVLVRALGRAFREADHRVTSDGERSPFVVVEPRGDAAALVARLAAADVHVSLRRGRVRVSPHVHNDVDDVERVREALGSTAG